MLLLDGAVNYTIDGIRQLLNMDGLQLVEKTVNESKMKFKFDRLGIKITFEIPNSDLATVIYNNFLDQETRDDIVESDFVNRFKDYLAVCNPLEAGAIEKQVKRICDDILSSKLFRGNGQPVNHNKEEPQEESKEETPTEEENGTKELGYKAPAQLGYTSPEEKEQNEEDLINDENSFFNEDIPEAELVEDEEPEEFLDDETIIDDEEEDGNEISYDDEEKEADIF